jgi:hypothetical protein
MPLNAECTECGVVGERLLIRPLTRLSFCRSVG